jgi:hypothetical protein
MEGDDSLSQSSSDESDRMDEDSREPVKPVVEDKSDDGARYGFDQTEANAESSEHWFAQLGMLYGLVQNVTCLTYFAASPQLPDAVARRLALEIKAYSHEHEDVVPTIKPIEDHDVIVFINAIRVILQDMIPDDDSDIEGAESRLKRLSIKRRPYKGAQLPPQADIERLFARDKVSFYTFERRFTHLILNKDVTWKFLQETWEPFQTWIRKHKIDHQRMYTWYEWHCHLLAYRVENDAKGDLKQNIRLYVLIPFLLERPANDPFFQKLHDDPRRRHVREQRRHHDDRRHNARKRLNSELFLPRIDANPQKRYRPTQSRFKLCEHSRKWELKSTRFSCTSKSGRRFARRIRRINKVLLLDYTVSVIHL